jgi:hypothetical protein
VTGYFANAQNFGEVVVMRTPLFRRMPHSKRWAMTLDYSKDRYGFADRDIAR